MMDKNSFKESLYTLLVHEDDARICKNISEDACKEVPHNFLFTLISYFLNKLADSFSNPKIILPWIMQSLNVPIIFTSLIVPIRESGALLPQLFLASYIRKIPIRKWVWVIGVLLQALCIFLIALSALFTKGVLAGWILIVLIMLFSLARGLSSIASKDVMGKTIPKKKRGMLNGYSASLSGVITLVLGALLYFGSQSFFQSDNTLFLLIISAILWLFGALFYSKITEFEGETQGGGNALSYIISSLKLLKKDKTLLMFIITRGFFLCSTLSAPFYILLAQDFLGQSSVILGLFIIASGLASLLSAPFWGFFSDISSKNVMMLGCTIASLIGFIIFFMFIFYPQALEDILVFPLFYFLLSIAHEGVRIGRKTYIVDIADGNKRTDYVAISNTFIGIILLFGGLFGFLGQSFGLHVVILALSIMGILGVLTAFTLPKA